MSPLVVEEELDLPLVMVRVPVVLWFVRLPLPPYRVKLRVMLPEVKDLSATKLKSLRL